MKIRRTESFLKDYKNLPAEIQTQVEKQLALLLSNPRHPSLRTKKIQATDKFEIRVTRGYRLTFRLAADVLELRRVGTHDILKKEA